MSLAASGRRLAVALLIGAALAGAAPGFVTAANPPGGGSASLLTLADAWALAEEHYPRFAGPTGLRRRLDGPESRRPVQRRHEVRFGFVAASFSDDSVAVVSRRR